MNTDMQAIQEGYSENPYHVLGRVKHDHTLLIRAFMPTAEHVEIEHAGAMQRIPNSDFFVFTLLPQDIKKIPLHHTLIWQDKNTHNRYQCMSPYSFSPQLGDLDQHWFNEGKHHHSYRFMGAHLHTVDEVSGVLFAVWAPNAKRVSVIGDFNNWHGLRHPMYKHSGGTWELFIPHLCAGDLYKFELRTQQDDILIKTDPFAQAMELRPKTASIITDPSYQWEDMQWMANRQNFNWQHQAISIYEVHLGSWQRDEQGHFLNYRTLAQQLIPYVKKLGYTHIELLPITEHPLDKSWGYQVSAYYAPTSRHGSPADLRYFIEKCHQHHIGVFLDWVPAHFPKDEFALARFDGTALYEHEDPRKGEHRDWGTLIFNYARHEVISFLLSNALYWIEEFHIDGLRVDAVASMLYLDYSRNEGDWIPNQYGGNENIEALEFLRHLNTVVHEAHPGALIIAEESTSWPMVSRPVWMGGLGFSLKWNMGWMNDTLHYMELDSVYRSYHHDKLTFSQLYAYSENFVLPLSHDEVVHMKSSMLSKMKGDWWQQFANLRLLYMYQYAHPGKKLLFMGGEFGQWDEWNEAKALDWELTHLPTHQGVMQLITDLNQLYQQQPALHQYDFAQKGFQWIDCHDVKQSIISFIRYSDDQHIICIFNFTPVPRYQYRIGVPSPHHYYELLNSDRACYAGSENIYNPDIITQQQEYMGFPYSITLNLPALSGIYLKRK